MKSVFPQKEWKRRAPEDLGFSPDKLAAVENWLKEIAEGNHFRVVIARYGYLIAEWYQGVDVHKQLNQSSATKSYYSCILGIAVAEGKIPSSDAKVIDYYTEMMDIAEGEGPKPERHAFEKDRDITFRQLICNTSGYMKPGEEPGRVFHYQTFGMNILTNVIATIYGLYDSRDPDRLPGCAKLIEDKIRDPIDGTWSHFYTDFEHPPGAKKNIFGHSLRVSATARDTARAGHLWLNWGNWNGVQVVPEGYLREATVTNPDILANEPEEKWKYGHGFWVNDYGKQWPDLPRDSFAASGAVGKHIWVCPGLDLVVSQNLSRKGVETMRWITRHEPHVDRCASIWLIRTMIDPEVVFDFISRDDPVPEGAIPFTLPGAEIQPTEMATTFDALVEKYQVKDPIVARIADIIRDFEIQAGEDPDRLAMKESAGVYYILRGLARTSRSDAEIVFKSMIVMDALYAELKARAEGVTD